MGGLGIGLGAFVDGMAKGIQIRGSIEDRQNANEDRDRQRKLDDQALAEHTQDRAYELRQRNEQETNKAAIDKVNNEARTTFDAGVKAGKYDPKEFDQFWQDFALPKMTHELLLQGNLEGAAKLQDWGDSNAAKKGGRLFASAMFKANSGDLSGALDDALEAGKTKGYIDSQFSFKSKEELVDATGNVIGYQVTMEDSEGNTHEQDIALDDVPQFISVVANPAAAWESQQAAKTKANERQAKINDDLTVAAGKAVIDDRNKPAADRAKAIEALRKRSDDAAALGAGDATPFDQLGDAEKEAAIQQELVLQSGTAAAPAVPTPNVLVDDRTGQPVSGMTPAGSGPAKGLGTVPTSPPVASTGQPASDASLALPTEQQMLNNAADMLVRGEKPESVARMLQQTGVDPSKWPQGLVAQ